MNSIFVTLRLSIFRYDGDVQRPLDDVEVCDNVGIVDEQTLIVDDLSDTGSTFKPLRARFPKAKF